MKTKERAELDYDQGHSAGHACREKATPSQHGSTRVSPTRAVLFHRITAEAISTGCSGKPHRYKAGSRKGAIV